MARFNEIGTATIPGNGTRLRLLQRNDEFSIKIAGAPGELMNSRLHGSEDALATLACERLSHLHGPRILIGGLGMGFTLAAALKALGPDAEVLVAELVPGVIAWNRGALGAKAGFPLQDTRTQVHNEDVARLLQSDTQGFDAIMLDVDNGPEGLTHSNNNWLYSLAGLSACARALRPKGQLAIWSATADRPFANRLAKAGFAVKEEQVYAHGNRGARHTIWLCTLKAG